MRFMRQFDFCDEKDAAQPLVQKRISIDHDGLRERLFRAVKLGHGVADRVGGGEAHFAVDGQ